MGEVYTPRPGSRRAFVIAVPASEQGRQLTRLATIPARNFAERVYAKRHPTVPADEA